MVTSGLARPMSYFIQTNLCSNRSVKDGGKDGTCITLLGLTADTEITEVHLTLGVAAGHLRSLHERGMDAEIASVESGTSV